MMRVVSVINYKGGVGKTTLTANLGAYAASRGARVLLIDIDPQTQLTFNFVKPEEWQKRYSETKTLKNCFTPVINGKNEVMPLSELVIKSRAGQYDIDIISSHLDLIETDMSLAAMAQGTTIKLLAINSLKVFSYLKKALLELEDKYDLVLIDCPPSFYVMVKNALLASDYYIIPARLDYLSMLGIESLKRNVDKFLKEYGEYREILGDDKYPPVYLLNLGVVPMMVNYLKGDELIAANDNFKKELIRKSYHLFDSVRNSSSVFSPAPVCGLPIVLTKPKFFQGTQKKIVEELKKIGNEFIEQIKLVDYKGKLLRRPV